MSYLVAQNSYNSTPKKSEDGPSLDCSHPGCRSRWSVKIDKPMCSFHQWGSTTYSSNNIAKQKESNQKKLLILQKIKELNDLINKG